VGRRMITNKILFFIDKIKKYDVYSYSITVE